MLKFVSANPENLGTKRKQTSRACDPCRRKKRRCNHALISKASNNFRECPLRSDGSVKLMSPEKSAQAGQSTPNEQRHETHHQGATGERDYLVSESSSEECILAREESRERVIPVHAQQENPTEQVHGSQDATQDPNALGSRFVGDLNPEGIFHAATSSDRTRNATIKDSIGTWLAENMGRQSDQLESTALPDQLGSSLFYGSSSVVQKVLLPILREDCLSLLPPANDLNALSSIYFDMTHAIIPIIDVPSFESLPSEDPGKVILQQGICLAASMNFVASAHLRLSGTETLLSHREFAKRLFAAMRTSIEIEIVTKKIVLIQALALMSLFTDGPDGGDLSSQLCGRAVQYVHSLGLHHVQHSRSVTSEKCAVTLFCCIWSLDRMNAAFHGRPVLMHERDIGRDLQACFTQQEPCFRLFLQVVMLLDKVIDLYRPQSILTSSNWEDEFPSFEDLLSECGSLQTPTPFLATIETLYHAVAILSCRNRSWETPPRSSVSYVRQSFSAARVTAMVDYEFRNQLVLLPFVPYAVSLSLRIAYRELRHSKVPMYRTRARTHLRANCSVLARLGKIFWSASIMAGMGESTLEELDRVYSVVTESQRRKSQEDLVDGLSHNFNGEDSMRRASISKLVNSMHQSGEITSDHSVTTPQPLNDLDFSLLDDLPDTDLFAMFDPGFDLHGIDACLGGNLDLSFPKFLD